LLEDVKFDSIFGFKYSPRPNTPSLRLPDSISNEQKALRLSVLQARQREIQRHSYQRHLGNTLEVLIEGWNEARRQWIGRTSQNKVMNFTTPDGVSPSIGEYVPVLTTTAFPNSLAGEMVI
jgi:tRNA-2-methylthio-N6-dimethylallyladenosine synthase